MDTAQTRPGFAEVGYDEAIRRAQAMLPSLRERAAADENARRINPETLAELHRQGLFRILQPRSWGGMELDFVAYFDIPEMLARGDASAGWTVANLASHHRTLALFDLQAQQEVWGENPDALIASGIAFVQGRAREVPGGIVLSGEWSFSSGVDLSGWNQLACIVRDGERITDYRMCVVPSSDYQVIDDWHTLGMRATGSKSVKCQDVFVPGHRALSMHARNIGSYPGLKLHTNPMYRIPVAATGGYGIGGVIVGNAQAALDITIESVKARSTSYTAAKMRDFQTVQLRVAAAGAKIHAARLMFRNDCIEASTLIAAQAVLDMETKLRLRRNIALASRLCVEAVDALHELAGAHGIYDGPLQRIFRDERAAAAHISFSTDTQLPPWGLVALGGEFTSPTL